jgi:preprotein translocase subunit SecE
MGPTVNCDFWIVLMFVFLFAVAIMVADRYVRRRKK